MKLTLTSTNEWADFTERHHQKFIGITEEGVELVVFVSRKTLVTESQRREFENELALSKHRHHGGKIERPIKLPEDFNKVIEDTVSDEDG